MKYLKKFVVYKNLNDKTNPIEFLSEVRTILGHDCLVNNNVITITRNFKDEDTILSKTIIVGVFNTTDYSVILNNNEKK